MVDGELVVLNKQDLTNSYQKVKKDYAKYWSKDFINETIKSIENYKHKMLMQFLWMSGVRITEAINLRKQDIDFQNYTIEVRWLKSRKYKTRIVPLHPRLKDILEVYTASMKAENKIFPISRQRAWQLVRKHFNGHPHQFRHSFAVNWLRNNGEITILHKILGHSKIQTTMEYLKIVPVDQGKELLKIQFD